MDTTSDTKGRPGRTLWPSRLGLLCGIYLVAWAIGAALLPRLPTLQSVSGWLPRFEARATASDLAAVTASLNKAAADSKRRDEELMAWIQSSASIADVQAMRADLSQMRLEIDAIEAAMARRMAADASKPNKRRSQ